MIENHEIWDFWQFAKTQWRVSMSGIVGIDMGAVLQIAEKIGFEITVASIKKLQSIEYATLKMQAKKE